jgi:hypothetical protein
MYKPSSNMAWIFSTQLENFQQPNSHRR